jgi:ABC-type spermidine/putrescine transport system permease subunit I
LSPCPTLFSLLYSFFFPLVLCHAPLSLALVMNPVLTLPFCPSPLARMFDIMSLLFDRSGASWTSGDGGLPGEDDMEELRCVLAVIRHGDR